MIFRNVENHSPQLHNVTAQNPNIFVFLFSASISISASYLAVNTKKKNASKYSNITPYLRLSQRWVIKVQIFSEVTPCWLVNILRRRRFCITSYWRHRRCYWASWVVVLWQSTIQRRSNKYFILISYSVGICKLNNSIYLQGCKFTQIPFTPPYFMTSW
jgi:hypothetical protein